MSEPEDTMNDDQEPSPLKERRFKIISLDRDFLIDVLNWWRNPPGWLRLPICDELPADCFVVSVGANWERCSIEAIVCSESFGPTMEGAAIERIPGAFSPYVMRGPFESLPPGDKSPIPK